MACKTFDKKIDTDQVRQEAASLAENIAARAERAAVWAAPRVSKARTEVAKAAKEAQLRAQPVVEEARTRVVEDYAPAARRAAVARERINQRLDDPSRRAPRVFRHAIRRLHRLLPPALRRLVPVTFIGYAFINGSAFVLDISLLWVMYEHLHWFYPLAVSVGYAAAGLYSLILNRWLNFQARGHLAAQGSRYLVGLVSQYVLFILGLSSLLHWAGAVCYIVK